LLREVLKNKKEYQRLNLANVTAVLSKPQEKKIKGATLNGKFYNKAY